MPWDETAAKSFGLALRRLRETRGLTQESLAFQAGVTKNQVQIIEAGRASGRRDCTAPSNPRMSTLVGLAGVLQMSVSEMLRETGM